MAVDVLNPQGLPEPETYRQVSVATGSRTVFIAGQVARDAQGRPVGVGDLAAQVERSLRNVALAVESVGGTFSDIAKLTVYVVDWTPDKMKALGEGVARAATDENIDPLRPVTMIGVSALFDPDLLVEIEAIAVLA